ncbi:RNA 2',3'-cyclic phosphodiesterase [bacterium]|nr:RNA 2',3'-cyclic phosphodiesterase [bacterium]
MVVKKSQKLRCFIAILLTEEIKEKAAEIQNRLKKINADVKWVERENLHITLRFLGEIEEETVEKVKSLMEEIGKKFSSVRLIFKGIGAFPDSRRPRVIWIGGEAQMLEKIAEELEKGVRKIGLPPEKPFSFHLTLGRVRSGKNLNSLTKAMYELSDVDLGEMEANKISLMLSTLYPQGPQYSVMYEVELSGGR